jgi:hypothetical protein
LSLYRDAGVDVLKGRRSCTVSREMDDWRDQQRFLHKAVMLVYNECPKLPFREFKPGDYSYHSRLHHRASMAMASNDPRAPASYAERLWALAPEDRQVLIQYAIWQTLYWDDNRHLLTARTRELFGPDVVGFDITERYIYGGRYGAELKYGLSPEQKQMLAKVAQAFEGYKKWQKSEERVIGEILEIEEETINRLTKLGESYRS